MHIRHGEVIFKKIDKLPDSVTLKKTTNKEIVAHSETGHHHILETKTKDSIKIYTTLDGETFVEVGDIAELWHQKTGTDVHTPHKVGKGFWKIQIKKEYDYFAKAIREVRD